MTNTIHAVSIDSISRPGGSPSKDRFALSWELGDARFHIWFQNLDDLDPDRKTLTAEDFILYKNPPRGVSSRDAGHYWTRQLNPAAKANAKHVEAARRIAVTDNLYGKAVAAEEAKREAANLAADKLAREERIKDHGLELLEALRLAEKTIQGTLDGRGYKHGQDVSQWTGEVQAELAALVPIRKAIADATEDD